jgi:hypothetical protein
MKVEVDDLALYMNLNPSHMDLEVGAIESAKLLNKLLAHALLQVLSTSIDRGECRPTR